MLLGGTVAGPFANPQEWEQLLALSHFKAVNAPFNCYTRQTLIRDYCAAAKRQGTVIAEVGVWKNPFDPNRENAAAALDYTKRQLELADKVGIPCCVNIVGTESSVAWDAADPRNFKPETYDKIVACIRDIIDSVKPASAFYCIEPMPWMIPDSPDVYLQLIQDVDRAQFGVHMDFVNMINCPRRFLGAEGFIEECFSKLAPYIKSTHLKDSRMNLTKLTTVLEECSPGQGALNFENILRIMDKYLPANAPVLLEHMRSFDEYAQAYRYVAEKANKIGITV